MIVSKIIDENFFREIFGQENCGKKINSGRNFFVKKTFLETFLGQNIFSVKKVFVQRKIWPKLNFCQKFGKIEIK